MPLKHLLKQVEIRAAQGKARKKDVRPPWLVEFIERAAELFEPFNSVARVGFDCHFIEERWMVALFLGAAEIVGGPLDGKVTYTNFCFDVKGLVELFDEIDEFTWTALPEPTQTSSGDEEPRERSFLSITGLYRSEPVRLSVFSIPPESVGLAMRQFPNGECDPI